MQPHLLVVATAHSSVPQSVRLIAGLLVIGPILIWFGVYGLALLATRPDIPAAQPATEDLGSEPPAIVSLLVNRWEVTEDAAESTLIDLAARHMLEFRQPGNDPMQTTVHIRTPQPTGLTAYEQRVFDRVSALAVDGTVPLPALTFRDVNQAKAWANRFTADVVAEARTHGLSQRRLGPAIVSALVVAAGAVAASVLAGVLYWLHHTGAHKVGEDGFWAGIGTWVVLSAVAGRSHGDRDTAAGREVASRWLGVRAWLRGHDAFGDLPPAAVAVWDRYLSYGAAVGATRVSSAVIDLGMGNRRNVWSSFGGTWHRVRVHYPRIWPRYGKTAPKLILKAVIIGVAGVAFVWFWSRGIISIFYNATLPRGEDSPYFDPIRTGGVLIGIAGIIYLLYIFIRTMVDLSSPTTITGEVVWTERWKTVGMQNHEVPIDYLAIDDGSSDQTKAWAKPRNMGLVCDTGDTITCTVRPWSRRVMSLTVVRGSAAHRLAMNDVGTASQNTEQLIAAAMGIPAPRGLLSRTNQALHTTPLLTVDEVGAVLGMPVTVRGTDRPTTTPIPTDVTNFRGPDGSPVLTVVRGSGMVARLAFRGRKGQDLPGLGDEGRGGPGWITARRGDEIMMMHAVGRAADTTPPAALLHLAQTAVGRMTAPTG